jgi:hypothetical protein
MRPSPLLACALAFAALAAAPAFAADPTAGTTPAGEGHHPRLEGRVEIKLSEAPEAAQKTIKEVAAGRTIVKVMKVTFKKKDESTQVVYIAHFDGGKPPMVAVNAEGKIQKRPKHGEGHEGHEGKGDDKNDDK